MIIIPYYNIVIVPGIDLYFQSDYFKEITQATPEAGKAVRRKPDDFKKI